MPNTIPTDGTISSSVLHTILLMKPNICISFFFFDNCSMLLTHFEAVIHQPPESFSEMPAMLLLSQLSPFLHEGSGETLDLQSQLLKYLFYSHTTCTVLPKISPPQLGSHVLEQGRLILFPGIETWRNRSRDRVFCKMPAPCP